MEITEQTLLEQMHIDEREIDRRRELVRLTDEETALLLSCRPLIEEEIEGIVEEFYKIQISDQEIAAIIGDAETLRRLHATQRKYVLDLFNGSTDLDYVNNRLKVGLVHKRIGVEPKLYLAAVKTLKDVLVRALERRIKDGGLLDRACRALDKLLHFDMTLTFDTYTRSLLSEVESARDRLEVYAASLEVQVSERTRELQEKVRELEGALGLVKKLEGVIPICGICKKIRDDKESWRQLEEYISDHSEAHFSHGLCPDCYEKEMMGLKALREARTNRLNG